MSLRTFACDFGEGVRCVVRVERKKPKPHTNWISHVHWTKPAPKRICRQYVDWMSGINEALANEWGLELGYAYQVGGNWWELWIYTPGQKPRLERKYQGGPPQNFSDVKHTTGEL